MDLSELNPQHIRGMGRSQFQAVLSEVMKITSEDRKECSLRYYEPVSEHAEKIHLSTSAVVGVGGGNGSSKTETCLVEMMMMATGITPMSLEGKFNPHTKFRGPVNLRVVCESLTNTLHQIILPKLQWWQWTGIDMPGGERGHWGWVPRDCLIGGLWDKSWREKDRVLRVLYRDPEDYTKVMGESKIQFMCLRGDQLALRPDGSWVRMDEITVGDELVDRDGNPCSVSRVFQYDDAELLRVRCSGGIDIVATPNHQHFLADGSVEPTRLLGLDDTLAVADTFREEGSGSLGGWALGWMAIGLGDGCLTGKQFSFSAKTPSRVLNDLPPLPPGCQIKQYGDHEYRVTLKKARRNNPLVSMLKSFGLWGLKSQQKFVPDEVFRQDRRGRSMFLHHLWNTDGTVNEDGRQAVYVSTSKRLSGDVRRLLWSLGIPASHGEGTYWSEYAGKKIDRYMTRISGNAFDRFACMVTQAREGPWPSAKILGHGKIRSIERMPSADVYCVEVDSKHHEFVAEGVVTHNSHDQDPSDFASGDFHLVLMDEPPKHAIWKENEARTMRVNGRMMLAMTWPDDPAIAVDWLFDKVYEPAQRGEEGIEWHNLYTTDNPNLDQGAIARQMAKWDDQTARVRIYGQPIRFSNRVHQDFTDQEQDWCFGCGKTCVVDGGKCTKCQSARVVPFSHVIDFDANPNWPTIWLLDPHPRKPHMFSWWQIDPQDDLWCIAEGECEGDPSDVASMVYELESRLGVVSAFRYIDPNMGRSPASAKRGITWQDEFDAAGLYTDLADDSAVGRKRIDEYLKPDPNTLKPRILWSTRCPKSIQQMKRYVWDDYKAALEKDQKQTPKTKDDDFPTLAKYLLNTEPSFSTALHGAPVIRRFGGRNARA